MKHILLIIFILFFLPFSIFAAQSNNKFGIHLAQPYPEAIKEAADLVNSNGGRWGYVTLVIQENDRNQEKWQRIFDQLRELHLIPIIRLATQPEGENWRRPGAEDAKSWVDFLDSLNWVVKNRYVVLFNEPNHGNEWGGEVDEKSYAEVSLEFAKKLKEKNQDFFIMLAGFDASAPSWPPGMEDEEVFLQRFLDESGKFLSRVNSSSPRGSSSDTNSRKNFPDSASNIFDYIDGWASHSYPNPGFAGSPYATGRGTVRTYEWEEEVLGRLGVTKELPVFITETGWKRGNENTVADYFQTAFDQIWGPDNRVMVVTPFVFDYQGPPFLEFSWKKYNSQDFYQQYYTVQSLSKIKGEPVQIDKGEIKFSLPRELVVQSKYNFRITLINQGQAIWDKNNDYQLIVNSNTGNKPDYLFEDLKDIKPFEEKDVSLTFKTDENLTEKNIKLILQKNSENILESGDWKFNILPLPSLKFEASFFPLGKGKGNDFEIQIFNTDEKLVFRKKNLIVDNGIGKLKGIKNIVLDELYRVVILKPYYLPRQAFYVFKRDNNQLKFKKLLPFDFNNDGTFNLKDIIFLFSR
jgi:hypothetical protein